ncbi:O-antigen ligase family protein [Micromonospora rubida]
MIPDTGRRPAATAPGTAPARRRPPTPWLVGGALLLLAVVGCALAGVSPVAPLFLAGLGVVAARPVPGLVYVLIVLNAPLGLWMTGVQGLVGDAFGGREYVLSVSAAAVVGVLFARTALLGRWTRTRLLTGAAVLLVVAVWTLIGVAHHGAAQTLVGVRLTLVPLLLLVVLAALTRPQVLTVLTALSWLLVANAVAAVGELAVGPARLVRWGFEEDRAVRYIGDTFRVPGLTEFNGELGILAGAYLLGYVTLWLTRRARPARWSWHAGGLAAVACLALSTSRSGALLVVAGVLAAVLLDRSGGAAGRRRARLVGLGVVACVAVGFAAVGATGARSLFERFDVWAGLLGGDLPLWGLGIGGVGAATTSRVTAGPQVFVDNYFVSVGLQYGLWAIVVLVAGIGYGLVRLWRRTAAHPTSVLHVAVLAGLAASFLVIEAWEYPGAMMCLAAFVAYGLRLDDPPSPAPWPAAWPVAWLAPTPAGAPTVYSTPDAPAPDATSSSTSSSSTFASASADADVDAPTVHPAPDAPDADARRA